MVCKYCYDSRSLSGAWVWHPGGSINICPNQVILNSTLVVSLPISQKVQLKKPPDLKKRLKQNFSKSLVWKTCATWLQWLGIIPYPLVSKVIQTNLTSSDATSAVWYIKWNESDQAARPTLMKYLWRIVLKKRVK